MVRQHNLEAAQATFPDFIFKVIKERQYSGGFVEEEDALWLPEWLKEMTKYWEEAVTELALVASNFAQAVYSCLQKSLQQE
jgi:hypothetical protein